MKLLPRTAARVLAFALVASTGLFARAADWPGFRGPNGNGISAEEKAPLHWGPEKNIRWKAPLPGPGNSSPIVSRGRVFITCAEEEGKKRSLYCFDRKTGSKLWTRTVEYPAVEPTHKGNPYCAPTPVTDGERVIVWHGSAGVLCYDFESNELWKRDLGEQRHDWGYASSPIIHRGKVILNFGPGARTFLAALDLKTGEIRWKHDEPGGLSETSQRMVGSWSTPIVATVGGKEQILCSMPTRVIACDPESGQVIWNCDGLGTGNPDMVIPDPVIDGDIAVAFTGWINGPTIGIKLGGSGNVTATNTLWREKQPQRMGSGVVLDGRVYTVQAGPGIAQCMECRTGKALWSERLEAGETWSSLVLAAGRFYVTSRSGTTTVFSPRPDKLEVLAQNSLGERSDSTPAVSDGEIFLRTHAHLYCIAEPAP